MTYIDTTQLLNLTKELIAFKSITPSQAGAIDYTAKFLTQHGFTITRVDRNNTSNLIASHGNMAGKILAFAGHVDVVPPGNISSWRTDPFTLHEENGDLYGRGIADMKGSIAAFITAAITYTKINPQQTIMILLTSDEEGNAADGTKVIVEYLKAQNTVIDYCILGEPSSSVAIGDTIKIGRRGSLNCELTIHGVQGHIAYPDLCKNPIHAFAGALLELSTTTFDKGSEFFPATSLQFSNINSGFGVNNVIPGLLFATFNIRYNNLHDDKKLITQVETILQKHNLQFETRWHHGAIPFLTPIAKLVNSATDAVMQVSNKATVPECKTNGGTSDGRFLIDVAHEIIELGLVNSSIHQVNEKTTKQDLINLANIYLHILNSIFSTTN